MCDSDRWPVPPYWPGDRWALRELLGPEEFERVVMGWVSHGAPTRMSHLRHTMPPKGSGQAACPRPIFQWMGASLRGPSRNVCTSHAATGLTLRLSQSFRSRGSRDAASGSGWGYERVWELAG